MRTRQITITPVLNGFIARVGCQEVVFTDKQSMLTALSEYYDKPEDVEKRFVDSAINRLMPPMPEQTEPCGQVLGAR